MSVVMVNSGEGGEEWRLTTRSYQDTRERAVTRKIML